MTDEESKQIEDDRRAIEAEGVYKHIFFVRGKGYCGIQQFMFSQGLVVDIKFDDGIKFWGHAYRFCYPPEHMSTLVQTLLRWSLSLEDVTEDPQDNKWIKKKGSDRKGTHFDDVNPMMEKTWIE